MNLVAHQPAAGLDGSAINAIGSLRAASFLQYLMDCMGISL